MLMVTEELRRSSSQEELVFSAVSEFKEAGRRDTSKSLEAVGSPHRIASQAYSVETYHGHGEFRAPELLFE